MRHVRILIYEGPQEWLSATLDKSLRDGYNRLADDKSIQVFNLDDYFDLKLIPIVPPLRRGSEWQYKELDNKDYSQQERITFDEQN